MGWLGRLGARARGLLSARAPLPIWHHEAYRLPLDPIMSGLGLDPRRADLALWGVREAVPPRALDVHEPVPASWAQLGAVHTQPHLEALTRARPLSHMFGLDSPDFPVDAVLTAVRLAAGGTIAAAHTALERGGPTLNLLGGFHHAARGRGAGFCPVNDIAIAIAAVRADGYDGKTAVLDLDAHPPDGTADCLSGDAGAWIGSLSGSDWGPLAGVDETVLPAGSGDDVYLAALEALLTRAPSAGLTFVIAGGDVLADDRMGNLGLTPDGVRARDLRVHAWLDGRPSVWLPGGGYSRDAWRVLARTAAVLAGRGDRRVNTLDDPMAAHFARVARTLTRADLVVDDTTFSQAEIDGLLGGTPEPRRLLGYYTAQGIEHALYAYGVLPHLQRLGYRTPVVEIDHVETGDRFRLTCRSEGERVLIVEAIVRRERIAGHDVLYIEWLTLRHPRGHFADDRPRLPGQDAPGLGLAWEAGELFLRMARRLDLSGIALRPAWLHTAWIARRQFVFVDPEHQGDLQALVRDLGHLGPARLSAAVHGGQVLRDGVPWTWTAEPMVAWLAADASQDGHRARDAPPDTSTLPPTWHAAVASRAAATRFTLAADQRS